MADQILIEYKSDVDGLRAQLKTVEASMKGVEKAGKESAQNVTKEFQKAGTSIRQGATEIATALGLAFGAHKLIEFGKESVKAFLEAEVNANKLRFAVTKIGGEGEAAFRKLIEQSEKLQKTSIFSDDSIQQSQTMLLTLGLNSKQVEDLIPKISDLASATGEDLGSATQKIIQGINGQTRGLKAVGLGFDATTDKTKNLAIITEKLGKFQGASADALETTAGKAKRLENAIDDIKESIGELIVNEGNQILDFFEVLGGGFDKTFNKLGVQALKKAITESNKLSIEEAEKSEADRLRLISESNKRQIGFAQAVLKAQTAIERERATILLNSEIKLQEDLRNLNVSKGGGLGIDQAAIDAAKKAAEDARKLREETLNALKDLDVKADAERLLQTAQTESEKLEILRGAAIQEVRLAEQTALEKGNKKVDTEVIAQNAITNINKKFDDQQADLKKAANDKEFEEAIAFVDELNTEVDKAEREALRKRLKEIEDFEKQKQKLQQAGFDFLKSGIDSIATIQANQNQAELIELDEKHEEELAKLENQFATKQISEKEYNDEKTKILKRQQEEESALKREAFEANKNAALIGAVIDLASGILKTIGELGFPAAIPFIALAAAAGALQIAAIESQPTPKFAKGVVDLKGKGTGTSDEIPALLSRGESVITAEATAKYSGLLKAMNKKQAGDFIHEFYIAPALKAQKKKYDSEKDKSFADSIMKSITLNSGKLNDVNILESLKQIRKNDQQIAHYIVKELKGKGYNSRNW